MEEHTTLSDSNLDGAGWALTVYETCFSEKRGLFRAGLDGSEEYTRHANLFALLSGLAEEKDRPRILRALCGEELPGLGTPFLQGWEMLAAAEAGELEFFRRKLEEVWGYMLDQGATTFWEGCGKYESEQDYCAFYGRPYGASLCHAWASGPAFLLPRVLMGLAPVEDAGRRSAAVPPPVSATSAAPFQRPPEPSKPPGRMAF